MRSGDAKGAHASEGVCFGPSVHAPVPPYASSVHATCAPTVFPPAYLPLPSATVHPPAGPLAPLSRWTFSIASLLSRAVSGTVKSRRMCLPNARGRGANCPACPLGASRAASLPPASPPLALVLTATDPATGSRFHSAHSHGRRFAARARAARAHALHAPGHWLRRSQLSTCTQRRGEEHRQEHGGVESGSARASSHPASPRPRPRPPPLRAHGSSGGTCRSRPWEKKRGGMVREADSSKHGVSLDMKEVCHSVLSFLSFRPVFRLPSLQEWSFHVFRGSILLRAKTKKNLRPVIPEAVAAAHIRPRVQHRAMRQR